MVKKFMKKVFSLLLGAVVWGGCATGQAVRPATPEEVVRSFLAAAARGDYAAAHACFAAPMKAEQPLEAFTAVVRANAPFFEVAEVSFGESSAGDRSGTAAAHLEGVLRLRSGGRMKGSFELRREEGGWKLLSYWFRA